MIRRREFFALAAAAAKSSELMPGPARRWPSTSPPGLALFIAWEGKWLWCTDSNLNALFKHDTETGEVVERIKLADNDRLPHGMTIRQGVMWYCDDVGVVCRLQM